ncbi:MAG: IS110 family transposase, partial [Methylocella sp.]
MSSSTIGIDISKDALDAYRMSGGASRRFANDRTGHGALIAWIGGEAERVVFEPTGPDHRAFERALAKAGRQARQGQPPSGAPLRGGDRQARPKTDRLAAAPLARMGALLEREARPVRGPVPAALKEPHVAREALVRDRAAARNRAKAPAPPLLRRRNAARRKHIERRTGAIEARMMRRIKAGPALGKRFGI